MKTDWVAKDFYSKRYKCLFDFLNFIVVFPMEIYPCDYSPYEENFQLISLITRR